MFGFIGAGIEAVSGVLGAAATAVGSACSAIGGAVISTGRIVVDAISHGLPMVEKIYDAALTVGKGLGLFSPEGKADDMYELGMRTERAVEEGVTSEQFDSNQAYIDHIREKIELSKKDKENLDNLSTEEKMKYAGISSAMTIAAIKEKYKVEIPDTFWIAGTDIGVEPEQFKPMLEVFENAQVIPDLDGFQKGELSSVLQQSIYSLIDERLGDVLDSETIKKLLG